MSKRVRLVQLAVTPVAVLDDGEMLAPVTLQPFAVLPQEVATFPALLSKALEDLQARIDREGG